MMVGGNFKEFNKDMGRFMKNVKNQRKPLLEIARNGAAFAYELAPHKTGDLKRGINYYLRSKKEAVIVSIANKKGGKFQGVYPYNFWINMDIASWGRMYDMVKNKTGTPRFFDITAEKLRERYGDMVRINVEKQMRNDIKKKYRVQIKYKM